MAIISDKKFVELDYKSILTLSLILLVVCISCGCVQAVSDEADPLDLLDPNVSFDSADVKVLNFSADANSWQSGMQIYPPYGVINNAPINLVAKIDENTPNLQNELQKLINQVHSVQFKSQEYYKQPEPQEQKSDKESQSSETPKQGIVFGGTQTQDMNKKITEQTMKLLQQSLQKPEQIKKPLELAEILFDSSCLKEAAVCYRQALQVSDNNDVLYKDKAWILFQLGNCLQKDDPDSATKVFRQLIAGYPESQWAEAAKVKTNLVEWYLKDKPSTLINKD